MTSLKGTTQNFSTTMKKFPFEQLRIVVSNPFKQRRELIYFQSQERCIRSINGIFEIFNTTKFNSTVNTPKVIMSSSAIGKELNNTIINSTGCLWMRHPFLPKENRNFSIKCKTRTEDCGEKNTEPHNAKTYSAMAIPPFKAIFNINRGDSCRTLEETIFPFPTTPPESLCINSQMICKRRSSNPNTSTKYLQTLGKCQQVYRGGETNFCKKKKIAYDSIQKYKYTGTYCTVKTKQIPETLLSGLNSRKVSTPNALSKKYFVREVPNKLEDRRDFLGYMTCVRITSNREKSPAIEFGVQNLRGCLSCSANFWKEFDANETYKAVEVFLFERTRLLEALKTEEDLRSSLEVMSKVVKLKKIEEIPEKEVETGDNDGIKPKNSRNKFQRNKSKNLCGINRRRRRPRWFSRIPIEPNVKGSVIFANGTAQELDDPCKILSVNFSDSSLHPMAEKTEVNFDENRCESTVKHMLDDYDYLVKQLASKSVDKEQTIDSCIQQKGLNTSESHKPKQSKIKQMNSNETEQTEENLQKRMEPVLRLKKISKLDKTVKCSTSTVLPEKQLQPKKRQKRTSKHSKSDLKQGSADNLSSMLDLNNYPSTASSEAFSKGCHAYTTNNLLINFKKGGNFEGKGKGYVDGVKSDSSFVKIKEISPMFESGDEKELPSNFNQKQPLILPGLTRPVTQKAAYLNLLESNVLTPVSNAWKKSSAHPVKNKVDKKRAMGITNKPDLIEIKGVNYQQCRMKSTEKVTPSKGNIEKKLRSPNSKKNLEDKTDMSFPLNWDYDARVPDDVLRKWTNWNCSKEKSVPITNTDVKHGIPPRNPPSASAINRYNFEQCKQRVRCRRTASRCRDTAGSVKKTEK